jgi:hypothetical protein
MHRGEIEPAETVVRPTCRPSPWGLEPEPRNEASEHALSPAGEPTRLKNAPSSRKERKNSARPRGPGED